MSDTTKDTTKQKVGGPAQRLSWLVSNAKNVTTGAFRLLVVLADHAKHDGTAYPSWARLKELTGVSHSSIDRQLAELKAAGLVTLTHHGKGSRTVNHYQLSGAINGWVSSPASGATGLVDTLVGNGVSSPASGTRVVPPVRQESSHGRDKSSPAGGTGNPRTNPGINPPRPSEGEVNNPTESTNQPPDRLSPEGLVDSGEEIETKTPAKIEADRRKADLAEYEAIPPCADCGLEHWTTDLERWQEVQQRAKLFKDEVNPDNLLCNECDGQSRQPVEVL